LSETSKPTRTFNSLLLGVHRTAQFLERYDRHSVEEDRSETRERIRTRSGKKREARPFLFWIVAQVQLGKIAPLARREMLATHPPNGGIVSRNNCMRPPVSAVRMFDYNSPKDADVIQDFSFQSARFSWFFAAMQAVLLENLA